MSSDSRTGLSPPSPRSPSAPHGPILPRLVAALLLRREFYAAVAADGRATGAAGAIVCLTALAREAPAIYDLAHAQQLWGVAAAAVVVVASAGWLAYGALAYLAARLIAPAPVAFKPVLRCMGYAEVVTVLRLVGLLVDPLFYAPLHVALLAWSFAAALVAMRAASGARGTRLALIALLAFVCQQGILAVEQVVAY